MPTEKEKAQAVLQNALNEIFGGLWSAQEAHQLAERYAQDLAEQQILLATATPEKAFEYRANIGHLLETMKTESVDRYLQMGGTMGTAFAGAVRALISILLHAVFVAL